MEQDLITALLQAAIDNAAFFIFVVLLPWLVDQASDKFYQWKASQPEKVREAIDNAAQFGVYFVKQLEKTDLIDPEKRKEEALKKAAEFLVEQGYKNIKLDVVDTAIESFLGKLNQKD